jgi:sugar phosphate permease
MDASISPHCASPTLLDAQEEKRLYRRLNLRILPLLIISYIFAYIDRVNISFAKAQMSADLGMNDAVYGFAAGIFFLGYMFFEIPSNLLMARFGGRRTIGRILILWGVTSASMMFVRTSNEFYALRFLLGAFEAGFGPGILFYLGLWYGPAQRGQAMAYVLLGAPLAGIVGGPLSTSILTACQGLNGLTGWQWLFLLEGAPCVPLGLLCFVLLDDHPGEARWLTSRERTHLADQVAKSSTAAHGNFGAVLRDPRCWALALTYATLAGGIYALSFWLPTLLAAAGEHDTIAIGLYSALPYIAAIAAMTLYARHSDRSGERRRHAGGAALFGAAMLGIIAVQNSFALSLAAIILGTAGLFACYTVFWTVPGERLTGTAAAGGIALINSVGQIGGFVSPILIGNLKTMTGTLGAGIGTIALLLFAGAVSLLVVPFPGDKGRTAPPL